MQPAFSFSRVGTTPRASVRLPCACSRIAVPDSAKLVLGDKQFRQPVSQHQGNPVVAGDSGADDED